MYNSEHSREEPFLMPLMFAIYPDLWPYFKHLEEKNGPGYLFELAKKMPSRLPNLDELLLETIDEDCSVRPSSNYRQAYKWLITEPKAALGYW